MKKYISLASLFFAIALNAQNTGVGVGTFTAQAQLHVKGENASADTKALKIDNSSGTELFSINNNGEISFSRTPASATGPYDILVRNRNTRKMERISNSIEETDPIWIQARVNTLTFKGNIPAGSDLNNYRETGIFNAETEGTAATGQNFPALAIGELSVFNNDAQTYQRFHTLDGRMFIRSRSLTVWSAWKTLLAPTGLEKFSQGNGDGWRLIGRDQSLYNNIGDGAVDFSIGGATNAKKGASGKNSVAFQNSMASSENAFATGRGSAMGMGSVALMGGTAKGVNSITLGNLGSADGESSVNAFSSGGAAKAWRSNILIGANGDETRGMFSTIFASSGNSTTTGMSSMVINGFGSTSKGTRSMSIGPYTHSAAENEVVIGANSLEIAGSTNEGWIATDPAFRVGIGSGYTGMPHQKRDGLQIYKNGRARLPEASNSLIATDPKAIVTNEFLQNKLDNLPTPTAETDPIFTAQRPDMMIFKGEIPAGASLDTYAETGIFMAKTDAVANSSANFPAARSGQLDVFSKDGQIYQRYLSSDSKLYIRSKSEGTWTVWKSLENNGLEMVTENDVTGYRISGRNPENYFKVGFNSVDLSYSVFSPHTAGNAGAFSFAAGFEPESKASATFVAGGYRNQANKDYAFSTGHNNISGGDSSFTSGGQNIAPGFYSFVGGNNNYGNSLAEFSIGYFGTNRAGNASRFIETDRLFNVGNGTGASARKDALTVFKNGNAILPSSTPSLIESNPKSVVTLDYLQSMRQGLDETLRINGTSGMPIFLNDTFLMVKHENEEENGESRVVIEPGSIKITSSDMESFGIIKADLVTTEHVYQLPDKSGTFALEQEVNRIFSSFPLESVDEGQGIGYRITNVIAANYGNIGYRAVDLSDQTNPSSTSGATGESSVSTGLNTAASGWGAFSGGNETNSSGHLAFSYGGNLTNTGYASANFGQGNSISSNYSFSAGRNNQNKSSATATIGTGLIAKGTGGVYVGKANLELTGEPVFVVGNGKVNSNFEVQSRSNALEIYADGKIKVNTAPAINNNTQILYGRGADGYTTSVERTPYKTFTGTLSQSGTGNMSSTIFENRIGTPEFSRTGPGTYKITIANALTMDKLWFNFGPMGEYRLVVTHDNASTITLSVKNAAGVPTDGAFIKTPVEIRVYN